MKTRILALAAIAVFALTAVAVAKTNTLTGKLKNRPGTVTIKIKTNKKGVATKVTAIDVTNFSSSCARRVGSEPGKTVTAKLGSFRIKPQKAAGSDKTYYTVFAGGKKVDGNTFNLEITLGSKKGRSAAGTIGFNYPDPEAGTCDGGGRFSAKVK